MNTFIFVMSASMLILALMSNYTYIWLIGFKHKYTVTLIASITYVATTIGLASLGRTTHWIASTSAQASGVLLGIGYYLLVTSVAGIILFGVLRLAKATIVKRVYGYVLLCIALLLTTAGMLYAQSLTVRTYSVQLSDSPQHQQTLALIADTHFGPARNTILAQRIADTLIPLSPDAILFAGDMYDGPSFDLTLIEQSMRSISQIAPTYFAPGNHEYYGDYNEFMNFNQQIRFINLVDDAIDLSGLTILGLDYRTPNQPDNIDQALARIQRLRPQLFEQPTVLIHHAPVFLDVFNRMGIDLSVHGHTHRGQFWPNNLITRLIYGEFHYGHNTYDALDVITTSGIGTAATAMRLFNTPEIILIQVQY
jgi:predicted MPP superfamily phosphohydrolase